MADPVLSPREADRFQQSTRGRTRLKLWRYSDDPPFPSWGDGFLGSNLEIGLLSELTMLVVAAWADAAAPAI